MFETILGLNCECELCGKDERETERLCQSCGEMIIRLQRIVGPREPAHIEQAAIPAIGVAAPEQPKRGFLGRWNGGTLSSR